MHIKDKSKHTPDSPNECQAEKMTSFILPLINSKHIFSPILHFFTNGVTVSRNMVTHLQNSTRARKRGSQGTEHPRDDLTSSQISSVRIENWEQWVLVIVYTDHSHSLIIWLKGISSWLQCLFKYYMKPLMERTNLKSGSNSIFFCVLCLEQLIIKLICSFTKPHVDISRFVPTTCSTFHYA